MNFFLKIFSIFDKHFPEGKYKNKLKCVIYNNDYRKSKRFNISYVNDYFLIKYNNIEFKFCIDPILDFYRSIEGYLKYYNLKEDDIVIDGGAFQGTFSILAAKIIGETGIVIAFEPDPNNCANIERNLNLNNINNVKIIKKGLWSDNKTLEMKINGMGSSFIYNNTEDASIMSLEVVKLDTEMQKMGFNKINYIKADVEGAEIEMIKGAKNILLSNNVNLAIASYHKLNGQKTYIDLEKILKKSGYDVETSFPYHLTTYAKKNTYKDDR